jgi:lipoyl(octanoyl) transferase
MSSLRQRVGRAVWLGASPYEPIHRLQGELLEARQAERIGDLVLLVEHPRVITLGRRGEQAHVIAPAAQLAAGNVEVLKVDRGGDATYHGPGQLVGYPIIDLKPDRCDVGRYVRALLDIMQTLVRPFGIAAGPVTGLVGLWVEVRQPSRWTGAEHATELAKLGAVGVRISRWVTMHGFSLNLTVDLDDYSWIVPCGITRYGVTSVAALSGRQPAVSEVALDACSALSKGLDISFPAVEDLASLEFAQVRRELGVR